MPTSLDQHIRLETGPRWDWSRLLPLPKGWVIRRVTCQAASATYLIFDPSTVRCVVWLSDVPTDIASRLRALGYRSVARRGRVEVWATRVTGASSPTPVTAATVAA